MSFRTNNPTNEGELGYVDLDQVRTVVHSLSASETRTVTQSASTPQSPDLKEYAEYYHRSEQLVADATKKELVECAHFLALQVGRYQAKHGEWVLVGPV